MPFCMFSKIFSTVILTGSCDSDIKNGGVSSIGILKAEAFAVITITSKNENNAEICLAIIPSPQFALNLLILKINYLTDIRPDKEFPQ